MSEPTRAFPSGAAPSSWLGDPVSRHPQIRMLRNRLNRQLVSTLIFSAAGFLIFASGWFYAMLSWLPDLAPTADDAAGVRELAGLAVVPLLVWLAVHGLLILLGAVGFRARAALQSLRGGLAYRAMPASVFPRVLIILYLIALGVTALLGLVAGLLPMLADSMVITNTSDEVAAEVRRQAWTIAGAFIAWLCTSLVLLFVSQVINFRGLLTAAQIENAVGSATRAY
ncbi:hypothetical protein [Brevibacterium luteolum]|uniref:hypothetical protein n=1 Tax=Brevibacterium luteolum TaxID=199591 RepID=UPI001C22D2F5|nr:hypothetical protein [Brevibacterium luteolum]MBU8578562.1 hypothetical protein [Brevibacterium luteolum]